MIYLNIKTTDLRRPEMIGSEPTERATWLFLCAYCVEQENGGTIENCKKWKSRQWQQTCGVTKEEAEIDSDLWSWDGDDLTVTFYPKDKQAEVQAKREAGKRGGKASAKARSKQSTSKAQAEGTSKPQATVEAELEAPSEAELEAELERKGKERKGIGKEEEKERNSLPPTPPLGGTASENHKFTAEQLAAMSDEADNDATPPKPPEDCPGPQIAMCFNEMLGHRLQHVMNSTQKRRDMVREAWKYPVIGQDFENIKRLFAEVKKSKFLMGYGQGSNFKASYDWIFGDEDRIVRIMEGQFRDVKR